MLCCRGLFAKRLVLSFWLQSTESVLTANQLLAVSLRVRLYNPEFYLYCLHAADPNRCSGSSVLAGGPVKYSKERKRVADYNQMVVFLLLLLWIVGLHFILHDCLQNC